MIGGTEKKITTVVWHSFEFVPKQSSQDVRAFLKKEDKKGVELDACRGARFTEWVYRERRALPDRYTSPTTKPPLNHSDRLSQQSTYREKRER